MKNFFFYLILLSLLNIPNGICLDNNSQVFILVDFNCNDFVENHELKYLCSYTEQYLVNYLLKLQNKQQHSIKVEQPIEVTIKGQFYPLPEKTILGLKFIVNNMLYESNNIQLSSTSILEDELNETVQDMINNKTSKWNWLDLFSEGEIIYLEHETQIIKNLVDVDLKIMSAGESKIPTIPVGTSHNLNALGYCPIWIEISNPTVKSINLNLQLSINGCINSEGNLQNCINPFNEIFSLSPQEKHQIPVQFKFNPSSFVTDEQQQVILDIKVINNDDKETCFEKSYTLMLLSFNTFIWKQIVFDKRDGKQIELPFDETVKLMTSWVTKNDKMINALYSQSCMEKPCVGYQNPSFLQNAGYSIGDNHEKNTNNQVQYFFEVLKNNYNASYSDISSSYHLGSQYIRLPCQSLGIDFSEQKPLAQANCIDATLLFASVLYKAGIDPIIIIIPGHALIGWRTWYDTDNINVLETTWIQNHSFSEALSEGRRKLEKYKNDKKSIYDLLQEGIINGIRIIKSANKNIYEIFPGITAVFIDVKWVMENYGLRPMEFYLKRYEKFNNELEETQESFQYSKPTELGSEICRLQQCSMEVTDLLLLGDMAVENGNFKEASLNFFSASQQIESFELEFLLGNIRLLLGEYESAIMAFERAIKYKRDFAPAYNNLALTKYKIYKKASVEEKDEQFKLIIKDLDETIKINPVLPEVYNNRGILKSELKDYNGAILDYDKALSIKPDMGSVYNNRGIARKKIGDFEGALDDFTMAIRFQPDLADAYYNRGLLYGDKLGNSFRALEDYNNAIKYKADHAEAYGNRAFIMCTLGEIEGAIEDYNKAIESKPDYKYPYFNAAEACLINNEPEKSLNFALKALNKFGNLSLSDKAPIVLIKILAMKELGKSTKKDEHEYKKICNQDFNCRWRFEQLEKWIDGLPEEKQKEYSPLSKLIKRNIQEK